jgi:hypothetical protein
MLPINNWNKETGDGRGQECLLDDGITTEGEVLCEGVDLWDVVYEKPGLAEILRQSLHQSRNGQWMIATSDDRVKNGGGELLGQLETLAEDGNESGFLAALGDLNWKRCSADEFVSIIRLALRAGAIGAVENIAIEAMRHHPESTEVQKYARLYAPMRRIPSQRTIHKVDHAANRTWLEAHAGQYHNQWIAVRDGLLLATASTVQELVAQVGNTRGVLLTIGL